MSFIERIGQKRVGFYCWKLFIINYFRGYEVSLIKYYRNERKNINRSFGNLNDMEFLNMNINLKLIIFV